MVLLISSEQTLVGMTYYTCFQYRPRVQLTTAYQLFLFVDVVGCTTSFISSMFTSRMATYKSQLPPHKQQPQSTLPCHQPDLTDHTLHDSAGLKEEGHTAE